MIKELTIEHLVHRDKPRVFLRFEKDTEASNLVRKLLNGSWSATHCAWYIAYEERVFEKVCDIFFKYNVRVFKKNDYQNCKAIPQQKNDPKIMAGLPHLSKEAQEKLMEFENWMKVRRYSDNTTRSYIDGLKQFLRFYSHKAICEISNDDLLTFNNEYILGHKFSASYQNQVINGVKLFFKIIELKTMRPELIYRPKSPKLLPNVLSKEEVKAILNAPSNIKHKAMLSLIYSCGLRRSELLNLKLTDIDSKRGLVIIRQSKGRKDRVAPLSDKILELLRTYFSAYKPNYWLFEGQDKKSQYDENSLSSVLKQTLEKCKINKPVSLHWLRHSYATHLLENGTDLRYIQEILGHSSSRTTEIYTHVSNRNIQRISSPFDNL